MGAEPGVEIMTAEPEIKVEPMSGGDAMRSMMDKLNPMDDSGEEGGDDVSKSHGDFDNDGDHDMDDHEKEKDDEKETDESYDNSPNSETQGYGAMAAHGNQTPGGPPGQKDRYDGTSPKAFPTSEARLMAEYKEFVNEAEKQTMSRAAKGHEKYGKKGMQALAKAGRDGKDLDKVRDKYNKYD
jgi:hypothetical protein